MAEASFIAAGLILMTRRLRTERYAVLLLATHISKPEMWLLLAGSSTLAGNLTLIASVANLIVAELSEKEGYKITFWEHLKIGLPVTAITLFLLYEWIILFFF